MFEDEELEGYEVLGEVASTEVESTGEEGKDGGDVEVSHYPLVNKGGGIYVLLDGDEVPIKEYFEGTEGISPSPRGYCD
ncbi:MAG: hypothetical protein ACLFTQ_01230 [Candidatus Aenigmatarchaeota archaeon]